MRKSHLLMGLFLTIVFAFNAFAGVEAIPVKNSQTHMTLMDQRDDALTYQIDVSSLNVKSINTDAGEFTQISIPGFHNTMEEGSPELPMMNRLVNIPAGSNARVEVIRSNSRVIDLGEFGVTNRIMPHQPSISKSADLNNIDFVYNQASYTSRTANELVTIQSLGSLRGLGIGRVEVSPVEYLPTTNQIIVHDNIEFRVVFDGASRSSQYDMLSRTWSPFFTPVYNSIDGARSFNDDYPDLVQNEVSMVVIVPPEFEYQMQDFVDWKTERGFNMIVGVIGTPEVGATTSTIQSYIHNLYNTLSPVPSFVLFVGDIAQCPTFSTSDGVSDREYCDLENDLFPEMFYGRLSATNAGELQAILDKTMMYDQFTMPDPSYLGNVVMTAGMDSGYGESHGNGQINYGTEHYFNEAHGINSNTYLYPNSGSNSANIVQNVSDGVAYINYTAHGSDNSWSDPSFTQSD
ncbi:hypothetical protein HN843_08165, partial [bacterium]|nr:hypothetical protein [bacterium]